MTMTEIAFAPMLAVPNVIEDPTLYTRELARYILDPDFDLTQKADGWRLAIIVRDGRVTGINRKGGFTGVIRPIADVFSRLGGHYVFDGELVNNKLYVFDMPVAEGPPELRITPASPYLARRSRLEEFFDLAGMGALWNPDPSAVQLLPAPRTVEGKGRLAELVLPTAEGFVAKRLYSPYVPGERSPDWIKLKRTKDADCVIVARGREGKRNFTLGLYDETGKMVEVGDVSALTGDGPRIKWQPGDPPVVVTVRYLSWTGNRLREPTFPRLRHDKAAHECTLDQLLTARTKEIFIP